MTVIRVGKKIATLRSGRWTCEDAKLRKRLQEHTDSAADACRSAHAPQGEAFLIEWTLAYFPKAGVIAVRRRRVPEDPNVDYSGVKV